MKTRLFTLLSILSFSLVSVAQTTIYSEDFGSGCNQGQLATAYSGTNGNWTMTELLNGNAANQWYVSSTEAGTGSGNCGDGCLSNPGLSNATLHVGNEEVVYMTITVAVADNGASYNSGGIGGFGFTVDTDRRIESPLINTTGFQNVQLSFNYMEGGQGAMDNAELHINYGSGWGLHEDLTKTTTCPSGQGIWTNYTANLNAAAGLTNLQIGFKWVNNDDAAGTDPSFAVDDILITGDISTGIQQTAQAFNMKLIDRDLNIEIPDVDEEIIRVVVTNIIGKTIAQFEGETDNGKIAIDLDKASQGIHLVNVISESQRFTRKFMLD